MDGYGNLDNNRDEIYKYISNNTLPVIYNSIPYNTVYTLYEKIIADELAAKKVTSNDVTILNTYPLTLLYYILEQFLVANQRDEDAINVLLGLDSKIKESIISFIDNNWKGYAALPAVYPKWGVAGASIQVL